MATFLTSSMATEKRPSIAAMARAVVATPLDPPQKVRVDSQGLGAEVRRMLPPAKRGDGSLA
jgi:hypothetical protein